ncbi:hypothetical protein NDU88_006458 [Pleurodeles waltl]|uniref:Uncharacterized protein n=1 Tax=Pleurodeles waltl TaxID=8319 RepID=A0AAV7TXQ4_PLEWA|nr:hypothetical protein NDU88_006458 [Pleurodeles waltl]
MPESFGGSEVTPYILQAAIDKRAGGPISPSPKRPLTRMARPPTRLKTGREPGTLRHPGRLDLSHPVDSQS